MKNSRAKKCIYWTTLNVHIKRKLLSNKSLLFGNATIWKHSEKERISNEEGSMMNKWFYTMHVTMVCLMQLTFNGRIYTTYLQNHVLLKWQQLLPNEIRSRVVLQYSFLLYTIYATTKYYINCSSITDHGFVINLRIYMRHNIYKLL